MSIRNVLWTGVIPVVLFVMLGSGAWTARTADLPGEKVLFEENFTAAPGNGWSWLREARDRWRMDKERNELLISPVWSEGNLKNVLLRAVPEIKTGSLAIEVHIEHEPTGDYEYAGLIWYIDDHHHVTIRKGPHGEADKTLWLRQRKADEVEEGKPVIYNGPGVDLRMVVTGAKVEGLYRAMSADKWQSLGEVELPANGPAKVGFRTGNGELQQSWARFSKFRIVQLDR